MITLQLNSTSEKARIREMDADELQDYISKKEAEMIASVFLSNEEYDCLIIARKNLIQLTRP